MKVLLINPPAGNIVRSGLPSFVEHDTGFFPPLGLMYVAAAAENIEGCRVKLVDCEAEKTGHSKLSNLISDFAPDVIGIQVLTFTLIDARMVAQTARQACPSSFIVMGGPHATIFPRETVSFPEVDAVVIGEGEFIFSNLLKAIQKGKDPESVSGVVTSSNVNDPARLKITHIEDLDSLPTPARHLVKPGLYTSPMARKNPVTTMMSSRGCPFKCVFCDRPQMGKTFRKRSAESVVDEMQSCIKNHNVGEIVFYDDTFTVDRQRVLAICDLIRQKGLKINWDIRARVDTMTPEMIDALQKAGCYRIHYGVETGSPKIQKRLQKNLNIEKVKEVFAYTRKKGIEVLGYFIIGNPDETHDDIDMTLNLLSQLSMDYAHIGIFTPYPGTAIYKEALNNKMYSTDYWQKFANNPDQDFTPEYWNEYFSNEELFSLLKKAYSRFYARPGYLFERLLKIKSLDELFNKAKVGIRLLSQTVFNLKQ